MILVYKLGLAAVSTEHRKECHGPEVPHHGRAFATTTEFMATIGLAFCSVSHGVYMIKVLAASTTILGMVWGVVESE